jgi:hypothetical protein
MAKKKKVEKPIISIHLHDGRFEDVAGIPKGYKVYIEDTQTGEEIRLTDKDNVQ